MPDFPATLPLYNVAGYKGEPQDATVRTDMESGQARVRLRSSAPPEHYSVTWWFTEAEMQTFIAFFETTISFGSAWFNISMRDGLGGLNTRSVRFIGPYHKQLASKVHWEVTAKLEVRRP
ncbi:MAG: hypothetical protein AB1513_08830 [Pseudomonadota bacterium]